MNFLLSRKITGEKNKPAQLNAIDENVRNVQSRKMVSLTVSDDPNLRSRCMRTSWFLCLTVSFGLSSSFASSSLPLRRDACPSIASKGSQNPTLLSAISAELGARIEGILDEIASLEAQIKVLENAMRDIPEGGIDQYQRDDIEGEIARLRGLISSGETEIERLRQEAWSLESYYSGIAGSKIF